MMFVFGDASLGLHLGMTGELLVAGRGHEPGKHDHLVIRQAKRALVFRDPRMFGALKFAATAEPDWWKELPPDVLSSGFTKDAVLRYAGRRAGIPLKAVLLQQERFPGVGNWMADEILWRCGFHPARKAGTLSEEEVDIFWRETKQLCRDALRIIGTKCGRPPTSWLFRHRWRRGGKCPKDGATLERATIGGRTTAWCPKCQGK
jgi:formamidopyrimidine-DNA glycosylase